jgi:hypothetical protein
MRADRAQLASMQMAELAELQERMMSKQTYIGPSAITLLGVLFVCLKLGGAIDWSWWLVTLPFWWGFGFMAATCVSGLALALCIVIYRSIFK